MAILNWWKSITRIIPYQKDANVHLNGEIITISGNKYFKDKTGNARHFLITGYDFPTNWKRGFPYKSSATISAPAEDTELIASDLNYYLYASGSATPNQIPVVSLYQDIDYEHKFFCKHTNQVLDNNGVEIYEPRVMEVVLYNNVKTGTQLTTCNSYYEVPTEDINALWVSKLGSDSAPNDGTKAKSYLTITKFISVGNNKTCYVKTGDYNEILTFVGKTETIIGIGRNKLISTTSGTYTYSSTVSTTNIKNFSCEATLANKILFNNAGCNVSFSNQRIMGSTNDIRNSAGVNLITLNNSYLKGIQEIRGNIVYNNCLFTKPTSYIFTLYGVILTLNHCKFTENISTGFIYNLATSSTIIMNDCDYYANTYVDAVKDYIFSLSLLHCKIKVNTKPVLSCVNNTGVKTINISDSTITTIGSSGTILNLSGSGVTTFDNNSVTGSLTDNTYNIIGASSTDSVSICDNNFNNRGTAITVANCNGNINNNLLNSTVSGKIYYTVTINESYTCSISNNLISNKISDNAFIQLGTENPSDISFGKLNGSTVSNNKLLGPFHYGNDPAMQHGVFIYSQNVELKYHYIDGTFLGHVIKSAGVSYPSVIHHEIVVNTSNPFLAKGAPDVEWYNNTAIWTETTYSTIGLVLMEDPIYSGSYSTGCKFKNNIICDYRTAINTIFIQATTNDLVDAEIDYNIYYKTNTDTEFAQIDGTALTWTQWQALGFDTHSILLDDTQANNLFTDYVNGDYSLKVGSTAIGTGLTLDSAYDDGLDSSTVWGTDTQLPSIVTKQQSAAWDIGAYIY
jgi:hypothetical protein